MTGPRAWPAALLLAASCRAAQAQLYPASRPGMIPRSVAVVDDRGGALDLMSILRGSGPVILLPIFTRCAGSCPILAENLKAALGRQPGGRFRVVVFSFDAADTDAALRSFLRDLSPPGNWRIVRAAKAGGAREFLGQFSYAFVRAEGGFVHPNELFVLSAQGRWCGTFAGGAIAPEALRSAARQAEEIDSSLPRR